MSCERKKGEIAEAEICKNHVHMLVKIPPKESVPSFMGFLKGKSGVMMHDKFFGIEI